jgi:predicted nucleic acid-binding protein
MELVVDANVLFSALVKDGKTAELLVEDNLVLFAPFCLLKEFELHKSELLEKTHRSTSEFDEVLNIFKDRIFFVPLGVFMGSIAEARDVCPDVGDVEYFALAIHKKIPIWTNDFVLKQQRKVDIVTTTELVSFINSKIYKHT